MFDLQVNDTGAEENSILNNRNKGDDMNSLKNSMSSCPPILAGMSHEMRTHMNAIVAFSFLMKDNSCSDSDRDEFSDQILSSCQQLITLFDSFLDSAIVDAGNSSIDSRIYKVDNLFNDLLTEFRETLDNEGHRNLELITDIRFSNSVEVFIDKNKLFRVIRSLFHNAIKNTKSGYIKIGYNFSDDNVTFYVLDSGQGYFKCKEFLLTENLNESLAIDNDTFTAINITLAKKLIQMLGGTVWIECNGLTGTGIYFSVPARMVINPDININKYVNTMIAI